MLDPAFTPLLVTEAAVVITDTELKTAGRTNLVRTTTVFRTRNFSEFGETTNWTNYSLLLNDLGRAIKFRTDPFNISERGIDTRSLRS